MTGVQTCALPIWQLLTQWVDVHTVDLELVVQVWSGGQASGALVAQIHDDGPAAKGVL